MSMLDRAPVCRTRLPILALLALLVALAPSLVACVAPTEDGEEDYGIPAGGFVAGEPLGKADSAGVPGPKVSTNTSATQVWTARNKWEDTDTAAARKAGIAWPADSGLSWDAKYAKWIESMERIAGHDTYYQTFMLSTPWGKSVPAPKLECAEMAIFLRVTFAAWYELPFYLTAIDSQGTRVYFGHFGARTKTSRYKNTPNYGSAYQDYSWMTAADIAQQGWPHDAKLRARSLYGGGDEMPYIGEGAVAGTYFDEIHLNKRVGHFLTLTLAYFGSMHLASARNTFNLKPESVQAGDVLLERWQKNGIGHTLVVKQVKPLEGGALEAQLASGSMPRRQPKWEDGVASKHYFTDPRTGGEGTNYDGDEYAKLGGGIKRFRVTKNVGGYWTNTWMNTDEASWISDTDYQQLAARPARFELILGQVSPAQLQQALVAIVNDARNHLRQYPASCSARTKREDAFAELYDLNQEHFGLTRAQTDAQYRMFEDYVLAELEYSKSKTCCWNSSTAAMFQIIIDYNQSLQQDSCHAPVVFKCSGGGYQPFAQYAAQTGQAHLWKAWSEDETCAQRNVTEDTEIDNQLTDWCELPADNGGGNGGNGGSCSDDGFEDNDTATTAKTLAPGSHSGLMVCSGDDDYYQFELGSSQSLSVGISFQHSQGDLDLTIAKNGVVVDTSESTSSSETVSVNGAGSYTVHVYGYNGAAAAYSLSATVN